MELKQDMDRVLAAICVHASAKLARTLTASWPRCCWDSATSASPCLDLGGVGGAAEVEVVEHVQWLPLSLRWPQQ